MPAQQISKPLFPVTAGIDDVHESGKHRQNVIDSVAVAAIQAFDNSGGAIQQKAPCDGELAVPEAGMMGAVISDNGQMKKGRQIISSRS
ncbi:MAG: hypothetical protein RBR38_05345 [Desulfomicrobium apsheronum]|nr:hypothetical protein [Desulfomicrobium apsheronum]